MKIDYGKIKFNRKQLGITLILLGLMAVMISGGEIFKDKLKEVALMEADMNIMKDISNDQPKVSFSVPEGWDVSAMPYTSNNLRYYSEYTSRENTINGYVKVFISEEDVLEMIKRDKIVIKASYRLEDYKTEMVKIGDSNANLVSYLFYNENKEGFVAKEYYLMDKKNLVKMCFYTSKDSYKDNMLIAFQTILESFRIE
ncbi:hypothetical protein ACPWSR_10160 [Alloiococcus sp. CFN-8]|uniref:hypothetical protein n=1 Tax=Alloiococcus sp. CFN-8 TaxID=3416081 RepID=UPI003CF12143